jgi:hypothetical protein
MFGALTSLINQVQFKKIMHIQKVYFFFAHGIYASSETFEDSMSSTIDARIGIHVS